MKRGIETHTNYDPQGRWMLCIEKARGKFTLDEIIEAAKEWEEDIYALVLKCLDGEWEETQGDYVELYRLSDLGKSGADWVQRGEDYYCSHCGGKASMDINRKHTVTTKFCPHCGYKMGGWQRMSLDKFISNVRAEVAKRFDLKNDAEIDAFFIGLEESAKDNQKGIEKRDKMLRDTVAELCEAKRLLKAAVEDIHELLCDKKNLGGNGQSCNICSYIERCSCCEECTIREDLRNWRYADVAIELIGEGGDNDD